MTARRRTKSRRVELERNLKRLRSSGRIRAQTAEEAEDSEPSRDPFRALVPDMESLTGELLDLRQEVANLRRLHEVVHFLSSSPDLPTLRGDVLGLALSVSELKRGLLALRTPEDDGETIRFKIKDARGFDDTRGSPEYKVLRGILNRSLEARETLLQGDILEEGILGHAVSRKPLHLGAVACLPLQSNGELVGALLLDDPDRREPFSAADQSLLRSFARHAALAFQRVNETHRLQRRSSSLLRRADRLTGERDKLARRSERLERQISATHQELPLHLEDYASAKRQFTRRYLHEKCCEAEWDVRRAAELTGLPLERLLGLLSHLGIQRPVGSRS